MSILHDIDDVLTDWHGSNDAMEWTPPRPMPTDEQFQRMAELLRGAIIPVYQQMARQLNAAFASMAPLLALLAEPRPSALDARHHRRYRNRQGRRR